MTRSPPGKRAPDADQGGASPWRFLVSLLLGRRLANREVGERKIGAFEGVPAMGLDGLGSAAYGPEAALTILIPLGAAGLNYIGWVMAPVVALLAVLFLSYWQTIIAYPNNGGAYIVAKTNLGVGASLLAAAALMIDYVLNVAVGISAGVGALVSAAPGLHPYILPLCLGVLALVALVNLRGTQDAGRFLALPTYLFITSFVFIVALGVWNALTAGGHPHPVMAPPHLSRASAAVSLWLLLRAFAAGCTAMTGVEAVSNGMSAFRDPAVRRGHQTLAIIVGVLGVLLIGIAYLAGAYRIGAMDQTQAGYRSVLSQLAAAVVGQGVLYYVAIGSVLCVLSLSANTSFVDFPRLCRMVAADGFLPYTFALAGRRLVYTVGIVYLAACSGLLLVVFGGITDRLIPLFAIGAFLTFTLSQAGMVEHWRRRAGGDEAGGAQRSRRRMHMTINLVGAVSTGVALVVIIVAKFTEGAWITLLVIPAIILLLKAVRRYYDQLNARLEAHGALELNDEKTPVILVTIEAWNEIAKEALQLALSLSRDVIAIHLTHLANPDSGDGADDPPPIQRQWRTNVEAPALCAGLTPPRLMMLPAPYRTLHLPVLRVVQELEKTFAGRRIAILIPQIIKRRWYQRLLHSNRASRLRRQLLQHGRGSLTVIDFPWS